MIFRASLGAALCCATAVAGCQVGPSARAGSDAATTRASGGAVLADRVRSGETLETLASRHAGARSDATAAVAIAAPMNASPLSGGLSAASAVGVLYGVHVASYRDAAMAARGWDIVRAELGSIADGRGALTEAVDLGPDRGVFLRLKVGPFDDKAAADAACARLSSVGRYCRPIVFSGQPLSG